MVFLLSVFFFGTYSGHAPFLPEFPNSAVLDASTSSDLAATCPSWTHAHQNTKPQSYSGSYLTFLILLSLLLMWLITL